MPRPLSPEPSRPLPTSEASRQHRKTCITQPGHHRLVLQAYKAALIPHMDSRSASRAGSLLHVGTMPAHAQR